MNILNNIKLHRAIDPDDVDNGAFDAQVIDLNDFKGAKGVLFLLHVGVIAADLAALKVQESDGKSSDTALDGNAADVHDFTTKPANADDDALWAVYVPLTADRKRYLQLQATAGDGSGTESYLSAIAIADLPGETEATASSLNVNTLETV